MTPPKRWKTAEEMTPAEHAERKYGDDQDKKFETDDYKQARAEALADAGLADKDD